jgi:GTP-binding protein EngB required for normal cell division
MVSLNTSQARHVVVTFAHVDELLQAVEKLARADLSPFAHERPDVSEDEARLLLSFVALARQRMLGVLDRLGIPRPEPTVSARWGVETMLRVADISLSELNATGLAGYGAVDAEAGEELSALAADLRSLLTRGTALLHEHDPARLAGRLAHTPGRAGEVLRALERVSTEHGLVEVRPLIEAAAERAVADRFDVGVFGRVSAGKSSLVNLLIGQPVLPVGTTPVTAVPVRIERGPPGAVVHLEGIEVRSISLDAIGEYATEQHNRDNWKGVKEIEVRTPGVPTGLRFLDTPGVGSLSRSAPAQAFAWLPRCDLGLVLIAAGNPVGTEDLALVSGLTRVGIACRVFLSKSDLLAPEDLARSLAYVRSEVGSAADPGSAIDVDPASTLPGFSGMLERLRRDTLEPLAARHREATGVALRARLHRLVAVTGMALAGRETVTDERAVRIQKARAVAAKTIAGETGHLRQAAPRILKNAVTAVLYAWERGDDGATMARKTIVEAAADTLASVRGALDACGAEIAPERTPDGRRVPPLYDPPFLDELPALPKPSRLKRLMARAAAARALKPIAGPLAYSYGLYGERLAAWGLAGLDELIANAWDRAPTTPPLLEGELLKIDALIDALGAS